MYSIESDLSVSGMDKMLKELQGVKKQIPVLNKKFLDLSLEYLLERAIFHLGETTGQGTYPLTDTLVNSFRAEIENNIAKLRNEAFHAAFVEFGTGIIGHKAPHEWAAELGIAYELKYGEDGWVYKGDDGNYYRTAGMEAHRYMYNALIDYLQFGRDECAKKVFGE